MNYDYILDKLSKSKFRSGFHLRKYMIDYINDKGMDTIKSHAYDFINKRVRVYNNKKDGKQTPMKGHPVFIAQHATATCCRNCLYKWRGFAGCRPAAVRPFLRRRMVLGRGGLRHNHKVPSQSRVQLH